MDAVFNLDEKIGKTVGWRRPPTIQNIAAFNTPQDARDWRRAFPTPFIPRGVYRFATHEEADKWLMKMITRTRRNSNPALQPSSTSVNSAVS